MAGFMDSYKSKMGGSKPGMTVAIGVGKPAADSSPDEDSEAPSEGEMTAYKALRTAMLKGEMDDGMGVRALKAFLEACGAYEGDYDSGSESEEESEPEEK